MNPDLHPNLIEELSILWKGGIRPDIFAFLSSHGDAPTDEKLQLVLFDQVQRWRFADPLLVEDYLRELPEIATDDRAILELAASEYVQRLKHAQDQPLAEFVARFPTVKAALKLRLKPDTEVLGGDTGQSMTMTLAATKSVVAPTPESRIGRYRLRRVLGEGSFAKVWLAQDEDLRRQVAIKIPTRFVADETDSDAYLAEAQTIAALDHPNIVPVFDVGKTDEGQIYIVTKFIEGGDLGDWIKGGIPPFQESVQVIAAVAQALHVAHSKRLVHRDIKPANILFEADHRRPYVADFGLAIHEEDHLQSGKIAGTPAYMSPEQARGESHRLDGRSDLFSLGVVFYYLLTGQPAFKGSTYYEVIHQVVKVDPPAPQTLNPEVPNELQRVCMKAISKRASDRYATGLDFADDLLHWLSGPKEASRQEVNIVPKGLRSFDANDADFFLDLLPGPRDRDGLPESIRFWKSRIEETDPDKTFAVGLIYGPSGCGKSSLVKAGLLPRLSSDVVPVYVEATPEETESRVLRGIRKRVPSLPRQSNLVETLMFLRRSGDKKVVIILDQFEQWLHAKRNDSDTELVRALRQCDGKQLQVICMVRDDFAMAASRFMREMETRIVEGWNFSTVDLFDVAHAQRVLAKFGRAFQRLPADPNRLTPEQSEFLQKVASGLAHDGKVVSVRIALFAEMVKNKPWTSETLEQVGGTQGIGVNFLDETFCSRNANPDHRLHEKAAREVLRSLLPETGTDIKGHMRSHEDLMQTSGYTDELQFHDLLRILDGELRLITPTDPEGATESSQQFGSRFYQLTHDYMVPSLREWLTSKQKETPKGRAELLLEERSALWNSKPESQRLPTWQEYLNILEFVEGKHWTAPQRRMMEQAGKHHADALVRRLLDANLRDVPGLVEQSIRIRPWTEPLLRAKQENATISRSAMLNICLALLPFDDEPLSFLYDRLLDAPVAEFSVLRNSLGTYRDELIPKLWCDVQSTEDNDRRLHAAAALAGYDASDPRWNGISDDVATVLTLVNPEFLGDWIEELRPVRSRLTEPLGRIFRNQQLGELQLALATSALADYAADQPALLADLIKDASPQQFSSLFPALVRHRDAAIENLECELEKVAKPPNPKLERPEIAPSTQATVRRVIESAAGIIDQDFAFCQSLPFELLAETLDQLGHAGYRPRTIRPYRFDHSVRSAVTWTRDDQPFEWLCSSDVALVNAHDEKMRRQSFVPVDVAVFHCENDEPTFLVLWQNVRESESEVELYLGVPEDHEQSRLRSLVSAGFNCVTADFLDATAKPIAASIWERRDGQKSSTTRAYHGDVFDFRQDLCPSLLVTDVRLRTGQRLSDDRSGELLTISSLWNVSTEFESCLVTRVPPSEQCIEATRLSGEGYRPVVISAEADPDSAEIVTASLWHRPLIPEVTKDQLARRQANAAVALLRLNQDRCVWPLLRHRPDPRTRSYLIHRLHSLGADANQLFDQLNHQNDDSIRRSLILSLGEFGPQDFAPEVHREIIKTLLDLYANASDAGIHGACEWTIRQWGRSSDLDQIDQNLATGQIVGDRRWYVNGQGQTLVVLQSPGRFTVGSPPWEEGREGGPDGEVERMRYARIDYTYAILSHPVTVKEFLRFRSDFPYRTTFSRDTRCPINNVNWYDAAAYCNWLSEQEGIPQNQWCYLPNDQGKYAQGMKVVSNCLARTGYRLPTDVEWEFACRAGSTTSRYYGQNADLDDHYAWTAKNALGRGTCPVGQFKPNDLGLFDMLGNVIEWIHDKHHAAADRGPLGNQADKEEVIVDRETRAMRPSTYAWHTGEYARCAECNVYVPPNAGILNNGFRVGRTLQDFNGEDRVENHQSRLMRGVSFVHSSAPNRTSYRVRYSPNFGMIPWGLRPARTID